VRAGWWGAGRPAAVADVVELARTVGEALGLALEVSADAVAPFHPGRCARVTLADGTLVGHVGELHPKVVAALGLPARTVGGELDLDLLTTASEATVQAHTLHTYPMAQSDVAVVVDEQVPADAVQRALRDGAGEHLEALTLFDVYRGDQVGEGNKSLAYRLTFRAPDRTLTTDEVSALRDTALRSAAEAVGAVQRA
jgi:phenylalanyl-tRNA synthetase beta chain